MVTTVKPIRPTRVEFENEKDMDRFLRREVSTTKQPNTKMNELMKKHLELRKK